jgi:glycosyltransferase involved in cell wall biosynthesis
LRLCANNLSSANRLKILLLNQCFYPDVVSTAQHLTDLAEALSSRGHEVTVIAGDRGYDDPATRFPRREQWHGVTIIRIPSLSFGKNSRWRRALNFGSFLLGCSLRLLTLRRFDLVIALTSPPLISFLAALFVKLKGGNFCFWVMDLNPDEAIAAGWLKKDSPASRLLQRMLKFSFQHAAQTIVLDRFMKERVVSKGINSSRVAIVPPWSHDDHVGYSATGRKAFRSRHELSEKFVMMYSGNHSPCHPLDTLLEAALNLRTHEEIVFCFAGGGSEQLKVRAFARRHELGNIRCFPYQPLSDLSASLSAADLHVVVMGEQFVGIVHPCKVYNIMTIGAPALYIGPQPSHITDIAVRQQHQFFVTQHGNAASVIDSILKAQAERKEQAGHGGVVLSFSKQTVLRQLVNLIEAFQVPEEVRCESENPVPSPGR